jgi:hypothetical protein
MTVKDNIRRKSPNNILLNLDQKKPYFGIPHAYCRWYLSDPKHENILILEILYEQMISIGVKNELAKITIKQTGELAKDTFSTTRDSIERKLIPDSMKNKVTDEDIKHARNVGKVIGILIVLVILYMALLRYAS